MSHRMQEGDATGASQLRVVPGCSAALKIEQVGRRFPLMELLTSLEGLGVTSDVALAGTKRVAPGKKLPRKKGKDEKTPLWVIVVMICFFAGMDYVVVRGWVQIVDDFRLHFTGTIDPKGSCWMFHGIKTGKTMHVSWQVKGVRYRDSVDMPTLFSVDETKDCVVRYDAASPKHFGTSWGWQKLPSRSLIHLMPTLLFLIPSLGFAVLLFGWARGSGDGPVSPA